MSRTIKINQIKIVENKRKQSVSGKRQLEDNLFIPMVIFSNGSIWLPEPSDIGNLTTALNGCTDMEETKVDSEY